MRSRYCIYFFSGLSQHDYRACGIFLGAKSQRGRSKTLYRKASGKRLQPSNHAVVIWRGEGPRFDSPPKLLPGCVAKGLLMIKTKPLIVVSWERCSYAAEEGGGTDEVYFLPNGFIPGLCKHDTDRTLTKSIGVSITPPPLCPCSTLKPFIIN